MDYVKKERISSGWYLLGGFVAGTIAGLLLAPKRGSETRDDIGEWGRRNREKAQSLFARVRGAIPARVKGAAAVGAAKEGVKEAYEEAKEKAPEFMES